MIKKEDKKDKVLYTCNGKINVYDYQEMCLNFKGFYWNNVIISTVLTFILMLIYSFLLYINKNIKVNFLVTTLI